MNNLAELSSVLLDSTDTMQQHWQDQLKFSQDFHYDWRNYVALDFFNDYYRSLLTSISDKIGLPYKNFVVQYYSQQSSDKWMLNVVHKDIDRQSCITVSVTDLVEPVCFYDKDPEVRGLQKLPRPNQISRYSRIHPTLVNVSNFHNVRVLEDQSPRILLQISYDFSFEEIINHTPNQWRII